LARAEKRQQQEEWEDSVELKAEQWHHFHA
jgi:hypothetical protein